MYLALGKAKQALPDLQQVLKMKPDFLAVSAAARRPLRPGRMCVLRWRR